MSRLVYIAIALSGLTALGSEVVWTRVLSLLFGATTYTFSLILAVFLVGLGIGSSLGSAMARNLSNPRIALGWCQLGSVRAWRGRRMPPASRCRTGRSTRRSRRRSSFNFQLDLMRAIWVMLPGAILWGASFPLALAGVARRTGLGASRGRRLCGQHGGRDRGRAGGEPGLVGTVGSQKTQQVLIGVAAMSGLLMLMPATGETRRR